MRAGTCQRIDKWSREDKKELHRLELIPEQSNISDAVSDSDVTVMQIKGRTPAHKSYLQKGIVD
jgi:hypothetical protein